MNRMVFAGIVAMGLLMGCAGPPRKPQVEVKGAWSPVSAPSARVGVLYAVLTSDRDDSLVSVRVPPSVADHAELHETFTEPSGAMGMRMIAGVALPAHQPIAFEPGGRHVMLIGLTNPLAAGDTIDARFAFRNSGPVVVRVGVRSR